jgi:hypothetical protein
MARIVGFSRLDLPLFKGLIKVAIATLIAAAITAVAHSLITPAPPLGVLLACGAIFSIAYIASILLLGVLSEQERRMIRNQVGRLSLSPGKRAAAPLPEGVGE